VNWLRQGPGAYVAMFAAIAAFWAVLMGPAMALMYENGGFPGIAPLILAFGLLELAGVALVTIGRGLGGSGWLVTKAVIATLALVLLFAWMAQPQMMSPLAAIT
jgi:hypothetical protein